MRDARSIGGFLFGVAPLDATTRDGGAVLVVLVVEFVSYLPARRTEVEPEVLQLRN